MQTTRRLVPLMTALIGLTLLSLSSVAHAQETSVSASFANPPKESIAINVLVGQSRVINFDRKIGRFSVSNPDVAEAVLVAPDQVLVNGKAFGQVNFIAWEKAAGFQTVNMLASPVKNVAQVQLQVRVAEVNRTRMKDLGTSYAYQGSRGT